MSTLTYAIKQKPVKVEKFGKRIIADMKTGLYEAAWFYTGEVIENYLSGQVLNVVTGRLRASITSTHPKYSPQLGWYVECGTNVFYGRIHEEIGVGHKKIKRPFLRPALKRNRKKITAIFRKHVTKALK